MQLYYTVAVKDYEAQLHRVELPLATQALEAENKKIADQIHKDFSNYLEKYRDTTYFNYYKDNLDRSIVGSFAQYAIK